MSRTRALLWAVVALLIGALAFGIAVWSAAGQRAEDTVLGAADFTDNPPAPLSLVSTWSVIIALLVIAVIALWVHGIGRMLSILLAGGAALVASQLLKENWLERPELLEFASPNTFPSGHMTVFAVICAAMVWAVSRRVRMLVTALVSVLLGVVAWQLLEFGWHRPSDLIGALALTLLTFAVMAWIGPRGSRQRRNGEAAASSAPNRVFGFILALVGLVVSLGGSLLVFVAVTMRSDTLMLNAWEIVLVGASVLAARGYASVCPR